jgi:hypothetical protein
MGIKKLVRVAKEVVMVDGKIVDSKIVDSMTL